MDISLGSESQLQNVRNRRRSCNDHKPCPIVGEKYVFTLYFKINWLAFTPFPQGRIGTTTSPTPPRFESDSLFAGSGRVTGTIPEGRIVVTGGGGNIGGFYDSSSQAVSRPHLKNKLVTVTAAGKNLVHRLLASSTPVTIIDKIFYQEELDELHEEHPQARNLLQVMLGDIRNVSAWDQVMTPDVAGVIHLAAVSRVMWCAENQSDCFDVNGRGTEVAMEALAKLNQLDQGQRWFLLASSSEVYGNPKALPVTENSEIIPLNPYGESKRRAEESVERSIAEVRKAKSAGSLYAVALRLATVYGGAFDPIDRLTPSAVTQALAHQVIQVEGGEQQVSSPCPCPSYPATSLTPLLPFPCSSTSSISMTLWTPFCLRLNVFRNFETLLPRIPRPHSTYSTSSRAIQSQSTTSLTKFFVILAPSLPYDIFRETTDSQPTFEEARTKRGAS